ncbi:MAG: prepilin peptidase [Pirellulales bacterium]
MSDVQAATGWQSTDLVSWLVVAALGVALGRLLAAGVARLCEPEPDDARRPARGRWRDRGVMLASVAAFIGLWWWEVVRQEQLPLDVEVTAAVAAGLVRRYAAHVVLGLLLAAASWIDLRHRVIPDEITVPGVLLGLAVAAAAPDTLLPIAHEIPRSFAPPLVVADVLGAGGGLQSAWPSWLVGGTAFAGLAGAVAVFVGWWFVGTEPRAESGSRRGRIDFRTAVLVAGLGIVAAAWWAGGSSWQGTVSSLAGIAVGAGLIWATRAGASAALGREAMGFGDVTLMAMAGAWLGWQACVLACFLAVFIGLAHGVAQLVTRSENELPFGPSLCLGLAAVVIGWRSLWGRSAELFARPGEMAAVVVAVVVLTAATLWIWQRLGRPQAG